MPLSVEGGGVAGRREHLRDGDLLTGKPLVMQRETDVVGRAANGETAGHDRGTARRAAHLGVHPREQDALLGHAIDAGRGEAADLADGGDADVAEGRVVPHDVDDVRRRAVLGAQLGEPLVQPGVLRPPALSVLGLDDVVVRVVDNVRTGRPAPGDCEDHCDGDRQSSCNSHDSCLLRSEVTARPGPIS